MTFLSVNKTANKFEEDTVSTAESNSFSSIDSSNTIESDLYSDGHCDQLANQSNILFPAKDDDFGWFEDFESFKEVSQDLKLDNGKIDIHEALRIPTPASETPVYVLESSLSTQHLWYHTAGKRPRQPVQEREYFEKLWGNNFEKSAAVSNTSNSNSPLEYNKTINSSDDNILYRGRSAHSTSVSKAFPAIQSASLTLQVPYFRVVLDSHNKKHAEFLVVVLLGNIKLGIWKRYSDFKRLSTKIYWATRMAPLASDNYHNTLISWECVMKRQRWLRCLDKEYLSLKCYLLEKFLHDLLFDSSSPEIITDFFGLQL